MEAFKGLGSTTAPEEHDRKVKPDENSPIEAGSLLECLKIFRGERPLTDRDQYTVVVLFGLP